MGRAASVLALAALLWAAGAVSAAELTRPEYVARLEAICKPRTEATRRAVRGVKSDVKHERLRVAAPKVERAKRIFAQTLRTISKVSRPAADRATLSRWFVALGHENAALGKTAAALRMSDPARFAHVWSEFVHEGAKANNVVVSFGFTYCDFKAARFE